MRVELCSFLRRYVPDYDPEKGIDLGAEGNSLTVGQVIERLGIPSEEVHIVLVNRAVARAEHILKEGDQVGLFTALVGG